jgi:hypothetical protein
MSLPFKISTIGNRDRANAFRVTFSEALALPPKIEAWDNTQTFPKRVTYGATTIKQIFIGTTGNGNLPMLYAAATTSDSPGDNWKPVTTIAGGATINRLKGSTSYIVDPTTPGAGESIKFNLGVEVPFDAVTTTGQMDYAIQIRYYFSGDVPAVTFAGNSGTESSPVWESIPAGLIGIRLCDYSIEGDYYLTLPESSTVDAQVAWITYKDTTASTYNSNSNIKKNCLVAYSGSANLSTRVSSIFTGNTSFKIVLSESYKADARMNKLRQDIFWGNTSLKKVIPSSFTGKAYTKYLYGDSWTGDTNFRRRVESSINSNACMVETTVSSITADSSIKKVQTDSITVDSSLNKNVSSSYTGDSHLDALVDGITFGTAYQFNGDDTTFTDVEKIDSTHFIAIYRNLSDTYNYCVIGTIVNGNEITYGTAYSLGSAYGGHNKVTLLDSTHFVAVYMDADDSGHGKAVIGTISNVDEIAFGTVYEFDNERSVNIGLTMLDSTHFVVAWQGDDTYDNHSIIGVVSGGSTITFGSQYAFNSTYAVSNIRIAKIDSTHFIMVFDDGNSSNAKTIVGTVASGDQISYGTAYVFNSPYVGIHNKIIMLDATHFALVYDDDSTYGTSVIGTIANVNEVSYGSKYVYNDSGVSSDSYDNIAFIDSSHFIAVYNDVSTGKCYAKIAYITNTTEVSYSDAFLLNDAATTWNSTVSLSATSFITIFKSGTSSGKGIIGTVTIY